MPLIKPKSTESMKTSDSSKDLAAAYSAKRMPPKSQPSPSTSISPMEAKSIAEAIMHANRVNMADGGMVDIESNNEEQPNNFDELNEDALDESFDSTMDGMEQPEDSNEDSIELEDEDENDMVSKIMKKSKKS